MHRVEQILITACLFLTLATSAASQKSASSPMEASQRCDRAIDCQKVAKAAFDAESAKIGKDCANVTNQRAADTCEGEAAAETERNFASFYGALEGIVGSAALHESQEAWLNYRKKQCDAIFDFWRPGTIAASAEQRCQIELTRSRMRDLDRLYDTPLHH